MPAKWHRYSYRAVIMRQSHGDSTMTIGPPYNVSMFESAGVFVLCCILFYTFEVPSQLKMSSCTRLVRMPKNTRGSHSHRTISVRKPHGAVLYPCDFYAQLQRQHDLRMISAQSVFGFAPVHCRNLSKKSHDGCIK